jgi:hypothetical protein
LLQELQVTVGVTGFTFSGGTEQRCHVVLTFNVSFVCEVQIATVGLGFAGEGVFQALFRARAFECCHGYLLVGFTLIALTKLPENRQISLLPTNRLIN